MTQSIVAAPRGSASKADEPMRQGKSLRRTAVDYALQAMDGQTAAVSSHKYDVSTCIDWSE